MPEDGQGDGMLTTVVSDLDGTLLFDAYYRGGFQELSEVCGFAPQAGETVDRLKKGGYHPALSANPIFPAAAAESRIRWAGLEPGAFELYATYENTGLCKSTPAYYRGICQRLGCAPGECLMVGNDVEEDMAAQTVGMQVFLPTDCLIN